MFIQVYLTIIVAQLTKEINDELFKLLKTAMFLADLENILLGRGSNPHDVDWIVELSGSVTAGQLQLCTSLSTSISLDLQ